MLKRVSRIAAISAVLLGSIAVSLIEANPAWAGQTVETYDAYANGGSGEVVASYVSSFTLDNITYATDGAVESGVYTSSSNPEFAPLSTGPTDGVLMINDQGDTPMTEVTISLADGDPMTVSSFDFDEGLSNGTIYLVPNGNVAERITLSGSQLSGLVNLSGNANFAAVTSLEILDSGDSGYFTPTLNNFTYTDLSSPPVVTTSGGSTSFTEGDNTASTPVVVDSGLTLTDGDSTTAASATVSITSGFQLGDTLAFSNSSSTTYGNISVSSYNATSGVLSLSSSGKTATIAQWQAALDAVTYTDTANTPSTTNRTISFNVNDGLGSSGPSNTATRNVTVADTDQTPIVTTTGGTTLNYLGGTSAQTIDSGVTVSDRDNTTQASATVSITGGFHSGDTLSFNNGSVTLYGHISVTSYSTGTGVLSLGLTGGSATDAQWANALDAVTFSSSSTSYGNRTISFVTNDGTENSVAATDTVDMENPSPVVITDSGSASFTAGDNSSSTPVTIDSGLTLTDPASSTLTSATVSITGNFQNGEDTLGFVNNSNDGNITGSYNVGVLTLTSAGNSASLAEWQAALESVTYDDTAVTPNNLTRTVSFLVTDANSNTSNTATRNVTVADTDQTPIVTTTGGTTLNYLGGTSAQTIDSGVTVSDRDNTTQASATVSITGGFHSGDTLSFNNGSVTLYGHISVTSYSTGTGVLSLGLTGGSATDAQWANALDAVTFSAGTSVTPGNRTISFLTNDGTENSVAATDTVAVSAPPIVITDSGSSAFTAGDNMSSSPVTIDSGLTVTDASTSTLTSATVSITGNFQNGEDTLGFVNNSNDGNITGSYNAGVLTLTSAGNSASLAEWQAALESVTYDDTAVTPNNLTRTVSFLVTDANSNTSNTATRNVTVADTDQTPIVTTTGGTTLNYLGGTSAQTIDSGVTVSDRDNTTQASATVSITGGFHSGDTLSFNNGSVTLYGHISVTSYSTGTGVLSLGLTGGSATDAQWANALDAVTFSSSSTSYGNRTISFVTNDGTENSVAATDTVDMENPSPVVITDSGSASFTAGDNSSSTPVTIDSGLTLTDPASSTLTSATVSITGNFQNGEDTLGFVNNSNDGNITGSYNGGVLTLTSAGNSASLAEWQAALESVTYDDTAVTPNNLTRTVSFLVTDANSNTSNTATRNVTVADTDQTPIVTTTGGTTGYAAANPEPITVIDAGVSVTDRDNTSLASATVSIGSGFQSGQDVLSFNNGNATLYGNIAVSSYNTGTGVLSLTSAGPSATDAQWANALSAVTYQNNGSPPVAGNRTINFLVDDGTENSVAATKTLDVNYSTLSLTTTSLPNAEIGSSYNQTLAATGGVGSYTWSVSNGSLPLGLSLDTSTGVITGVTNTTGPANFTVQVTDANSQIASRPLSITVEAVALFAVIPTSTPTSTLIPWIPKEVSLAIPGGPAFGQTIHLAISIMIGDLFAGHGTVKFMVGRFEICRAKVVIGTASCSSRSIPGAGTLHLRVLYSAGGPFVQIANQELVVRPAKARLALETERDSRGGITLKITAEGSTQGTGTPRGYLQITASNGWHDKVTLEGGQGRVRIPKGIAQVEVILHAGTDFSGATKTLDIPDS